MGEAKETESERLARLVLTCGRRGKRVDEIMQIALRELNQTFRQPDIRTAHHREQELSSLVMEAIWRWWIPAARKKLGSGDWTSQNLISKLRTSLCWYAKGKNLRVIKRERRIRDNEKGYGDLCMAETEACPQKQIMSFQEDEERLLNALEQQQDFEYSPDEERFLSKLECRSKFKKIGRPRLLMAIRILVTMRRATTERPWTKQWSWSKMLQEIASIIGRFEK